MLELRLVNENGYTVTVPGYETVVVVSDELADATEQLLLGEPAEADTALWRQVALSHAEGLGGEKTINGRNALAKAKYHNARDYRVKRHQL